MLLRQQLGRRHQRRLISGRRRLQRRGRGHQRLAGAHVALQQAHHRARPGQVGAELADHPQLRRGQPERQLRLQPPEQLLAAGDRCGAAALGPPAQSGEAQLIRQQFLQDQPLPRRVGLGQDIFRPQAGRRLVQLPQGGDEAGQALGAEQRLPAGMLQHAAIALRPVQSPADQLAQGDLRQALGRRIQRRQGVGAGRSGIRRQQLVLGMEHPQRAPPQADLAEAAHPRARHQLLLLERAEAHEVQLQRGAGVVLQPHPQAAPAEELHPRAAHHPLHPAAHARLQLAERHRAGAVLVVPRQVQQQVVDAGDAKPPELLPDAGADSRQLQQGRDRRVGGGRLGPPHAPRQASRCRMASISTAAPFGRAATPTAARAG